MIITVELSDAAHAALLVHAKVQGKDPAAVAAEQLEELYADCEPDAIKAIAEALAEIDSGEPGMLLEDYIAQCEAEKAARKQEREEAGSQNVRGASQKAAA